MLIDDGRGRGFKAAVTYENKLDVCAVVSTIDLYCNQKNGISYSVVVAETPTTSGSCFCYVKNEDTKDLIMSSVKIYCDSNEVFIVKLNDNGTPVGGSDNLPVNRKSGCGNVANVICKCGSGLTGLSGGGVVEAIVIEAGKSSRRYEWFSGLIVPRNHVVSFYVENGTAFLRATISLHFCECNA